MFERNKRKKKAIQRHNSLRSLFPSKFSKPRPSISSASPLFFSPLLLENNTAYLLHLTPILVYNPPTFELSVGHLMSILLVYVVLVAVPAVFKVATGSNLEPLSTPDSFHTEFRSGSAICQWVLIDLSLLPLQQFAGRNPDHCFICSLLREGYPRLLASSPPACSSPLVRCL
ncbi:hypothetical protein BJY00DRAFT_147737 [Aspergillus carlsbadensis]|nr:hypothetical protein BJY00DRAFT_147737 [Aspergillus carlsbadensis]